MSKQKSNKFYLLMGVVFSVSLVFILLGTLAGVSLYNVFEKESEIVGNAKIEELPGDEEKIIISDDESVFFSYVYPMFVFNKTDYTDESGETQSVYTESKTTEKLQFLPDEKDYTIFINGKKCVTVKEKGMVSAQVSMLFMNEHGQEYPALFTIKFVFYSDRTVFSISFRDAKVGGYLNRMAQTGFNVRVVERPATESPKFEFDGLNGFKVGEELPGFYINTSLIPSAIWFENGVGEIILSGSNFSIYCGVNESYINYTDSNGLSQKLSFYRNRTYECDFCFLPSEVSYLINEISGVGNASLPMWSRWISSEKFSNTSACEKKKIRIPEIIYDINGQYVSAQINTLSLSEIGIVQIFKGTELIEESTTISYGSIRIFTTEYTPGIYTVKAQSLSGNHEMFLDSDVVELQFEIKAEDLLEKDKQISKLYIDTSPEGTSAMKAAFNELVSPDSYLETACAKFRLDNLPPIIMQGSNYLELCFLRLGLNDFCLLFHNDKQYDPGSIGGNHVVKTYTVVYSTKAGAITIGNTKLQAVAGWQNLDEEGGIIYEYPKKIYVNWVNENSVAWVNYKPYIKAN